jgi:hypothetical protein
MDRSALKKERRIVSTLLGAMAFSVSVLSQAGPVSAEEYDCRAPENRDTPMTMEITLSPKWKARTQEVRDSIRSENETMKVRVRIYPFLDPPPNIGIGKCVTAVEARLAIREAIKYYGKLSYLIRQDILPHHWVKAGATDVDERTWLSIRPEDLARLSDPALSTERFHEVYRELATPKERHLPFGMGKEKIEKSP